MSVFVEIVFTIFIAWGTWWLVRKLLRPQSPAEPADEPFASRVGAPVKRGPKGRACAVAIEEPDDDKLSDYFPPRSL